MTREKFISYEPLEGEEVILWVRWYEDNSDVPRYLGYAGDAPGQGITEIQVFHEDQETELTEEEEEHHLKEIRKNLSNYKPKTFWDWVENEITE